MSEEPSNEPDTLHHSLCDLVIAGDLDQSVVSALWFISDLSMLWEAAQDVVNPERRLPHQRWGQARKAPAAAESARAMLATAAEFVAEWLESGPQDRRASEQVFVALAAARAARGPANLCGRRAASMTAALADLSYEIFDNLQWLRPLRPLIELACLVLQTEAPKSYSPIEKHKRFDEAVAEGGAEPESLAGELAAAMAAALAGFDEWQAEAEVNIEFASAAAFRVASGLNVARGAGAPQPVRRRRRRRAESKHRTWAKWHSEGMSYGQIVQRHADETGEELSRDAIVNGIKRLGPPDPD